LEAAKKPKPPKPQKPTLPTSKQATLKMKKAELQAAQSSLDKQQANARKNVLGHKHGTKKVSTGIKLGHKNLAKGYDSDKAKKTGGGEGLLSKEFQRLKGDVKKLVKKR
jgi:hypothetical protein